MVSGFLCIFSRHIELVLLWCHCAWHNWTNFSSILQSSVCFFLLADFGINIHWSWLIVPHNFLDYFYFQKRNLKTHRKIQAANYPLTVFAVLRYFLTKENWNGSYPWCGLVSLNNPCMRVSTIFVYVILQLICITSLSISLHTNTHIL